MSGRVYLCLYHDLAKAPTEHRVRLEREDPLNTQKPDGLILCSVSPIFPVAETAYVPGDKDSYDVVFVVHRQPFIQIGKLDADARKFVWFSLGITALIVIVPHGETGAVEKLEKSDILCREAWTVKSGILVEPHITFDPLPLVTVKAALPEKLPENQDVRRIIRELHLNFNSLIKRAQVLAPSLVFTAEQMLAAAGREIQRLVAAEAALDKAVAAISSSEVKVGDANSSLYLASHKQLNLSLDALVQLNSALAYIISQTFYGGPPLLQNISLNSCHSLLGVGTAIKAIQRLAEFIIEGFAEHPLSRIVELHYRDITVDTHLKRNGEFPKGRTVDFYQPQVGRRPQTPKLVYFSTRMGFSEHGYCVTAATQCLASADAARRNLLTLTHELLHSHVKGLFATILAGVPESDLDDAQLVAIVREYKMIGKLAAASPDVQRNWTILQYLRFRIFSFSDGMHKIVSEYPTCRIDGAPAKNIEPGPDRDDHSEVRRFKSSFEFMNELVVHILDLHYFYDESERIYLSTLWTSWATVPGVADKIEWYILRSITAVSVLNIKSLATEDFDHLPGLTEPCGKELQERFDESLRMLISVIEELCGDEHRGAMLHVVLAKLKSAPTVLWLRAAFFPCHLFAQNVKQFLYSPGLREHFDSFDDPLADRDEEGEPVYQLQSLEFPTGPIRNPVALLRDRLLREFDGPEASDEETRSAWLFLALASAPPKP